MRRSLLRGDADPGEPDDEQDLGEHEIAEPQLLLEHIAARLDTLLLAPKLFADIADIAHGRAAFKYLSLMMLT